MTAIPDELGVFALPSTVLFPNALLPLHIFEPRYKALLEDAVGSGGHLVMAILKPGYEADYYGAPELFETACVGRIVEQQEQPDGNIDIILRGEAAVRIQGYVDHDPYRMARVTPVTDGELVADPLAPPPGSDLRELLELACPGCLAVLREGWPGDFDRECSVELLHTVAMHLPVSVETRLEWLGCRSAAERWRRIRAALIDLAKSRTTQSRVLSRYRDLRPEEMG
ncbi:MAG: hypothetical protein HKN12_11055, partial [Gemmatimonadetes bacterium]|nr:hypothetical protein [Gemmatimonadota bacterium]